jgi:hypothetical protein
MNDTPELLVDFTNNQIKPYFIEHLIGISDLSRDNILSQAIEIDHDFADEVIVGQINIEVVKTFLDFFETQGRPDVYTNLVYNFEVAEFYTCYASVAGILVRA